MNTIVVDANLLCLIVAGHFSPASIGRHKRLKAFDIEDFQKVMDITNFFDAAATCPNVLTETSNLLSATNDYERAILLAGLAKLLDKTQEHHTPSFMACSSHHYQRLGLTDAVLLTASIAGAVLLTVDLGLVLAAHEINRPVINYNWVRDDAINRQSLGL